jgi:hypothetical protein
LGWILPLPLAIAIPYILVFNSEFACAGDVPTYINNRGYCDINFLPFLLKADGVCNTMSCS